MKKCFRFNMVEIVLAIAIIAIGISSILVLFPIGIQQTRSAMDENSISDVSESIALYVRGQLLNQWKNAGSAPAWLELTAKPGNAASPNLTAVAGFSRTFSVNGVEFIDGLQSTGTAGLFKFTRVADDGTEIFSADVRIWGDNGGLAAAAAQTSGNCPLYVPDTADNLSPKMVASGGISLKASDGTTDVHLTQIIQSVMVEIVWGADGENQRSFRVDVYNPYFEI